jgi:2,3-diketo-5-methylthio-1-phosphopentane phosphatase
VSRLRLDCHVLIDFDGTIVPKDATDRILETFADPAWLAIEADWQAGRIPSRQCLSAQVGLLRVSPADLDSLVSTFDVDPAFPAFVDLCRRRGVKTTIVSDGMDRVVGRVLARAGLDVPFKANRLVHTGDDRWTLEFPHMRQACVSGSGNCKCATAMGASAGMTVMVGDGRSDFCVSTRTTFVLAKSQLAVHCATNRLPHGVFTDFSDATPMLADWLDLQGIGEPSTVPAIAVARPRFARI